VGKITQGILGAFSGKVGSVVGASWRGIDYMRSVPNISTIPRTEAQNAQTSKMSLFRGFLLGIDDLVKRCFQNFSQYTEMNGALSYNMKYAVGGVFPDLVVNFPALIYAKGDLLSCWGPKATSKNISNVTVTWKNRTFSNMSAASDLINIVLYSTKERQFHIFESIALRSEKSVTLTLPAVESGHRLHCYLNFYSDALEISSTNEYLGEVVIE
jgi:hypothetical protein